MTDRVPQESIFTNVRGRIHGAHHVLACVNEPNANVGYEIGHVLGRGACVSLFSSGRGKPPAWLDHSPMESFGVAPVNSGQQLLDLVHSAAGSPGRVPRQTRPSI